MQLSSAAMPANLKLSNWSVEYTCEELKIIPLIKLLIEYEYVPNQSPSDHDVGFPFLSSLTNYSINFLFFLGSTDLVLTLDCLEDSSDD